MAQLVASARDEDLDGAEALLARGHDSLAGAWSGDVACERLDDTRGAGAVGGHRVERLRVTRDEQHVCALGREQADGRGTDAPAGAGHHAHASTETQVHQPPQSPARASAAASPASLRRPISAGASRHSS